jgi:hypothetical protein
MTDTTETITYLVDQMADEAAAMISELAVLVPPHDELWPLVSQLGSHACRIASACEKLRILLAAVPLREAHQALYDQVEAIAAAESMSLAELMRRQLELFIEQHCKLPVPSRAANRRVTDLHAAPRPAGRRSYGRRSPG